jgi:hypothetical protein
MLGTRIFWISEFFPDFEIFAYIIYIYIIYISYIYDLGGEIQV